jgi:hypothetical protein
MAETSDFRIVNDYVLKVADGAGSPKEYIITVEPGVGTVKVQPEAYGETQMKTSAGAMVGQPRKTSQMRHAEFQVTNARIKDPGVNTSEAVLYDLLRTLGYVSTTWTTTEAGGDLRAYSATLAAANRTSGATGITHTIADAWIVQESVDLTHSEEGVFASFTLRGNALVDTRVAA